MEPIIFWLLIVMSVKVYECVCKWKGRKGKRYENGRASIHTENQPKFPLEHQGYAIKSLNTVYFPFVFQPQASINIHFLTSSRPYNNLCISQRLKVHRYRMPPRQKKKKGGGDNDLQKFALPAPLVASNISMRLLLTVIRTGHYGNMKGSNIEVL